MKYSLFPSLIFCVAALSGCAFFGNSKPRVCADQLAIADHAQEKSRWDAAAAKVKLGMRRSRVETFLPKAHFMDPQWQGITSSGAYEKHGVVEWYYLSRHFICELTYAYTGTISDPDIEFERESQQKLLVLPKIVQVIRPPSNNSLW